MMPEKNEDSSMDWLSSLSQGGLPQIIAGPAGKAISRLIGGLADIPAAYLEGVAQSARDKTEARSHVSKKIAEKAGMLAIENPAVMDRAVNSLLTKSYRAQTNKEAVAKIAVEELIETPPPADSEGPSEDWLNKFERYAEDASSEEIRIMFGRLLAGEVRHPGEIASATLRFVSEMDSEVAKIIRRILPYATVKGEVFLGLIEPNLTYTQKKLLEQAGFWSHEANIRLSISPEANSDMLVEIVVLRKDKAARVSFSQSRTVEFESAYLTKPGRDLLSITETNFDFTKLAETLTKFPQVSNVREVQCVKTPDGWMTVDV